MARSQVDGIGIEEQLDDPQTVSDTYVRPPTPQPSGLHDLADTLSNFSHDISGFVQQQQQKANDADQMRAQALALKLNGKGYAQGVADGSIPPTASPVFQTAYKTAQGQIMGKQLAAGATDAYQTWSGRNSQDPNDFDNFLSGYIKQNLTTDDPDVLKGALPYVQSASTDLINANDTERNTNLYNSSVSAHIGSSANTIDTASDQFQQTGKPEDYTGLWNNLMTDRQAALASGIKADDYDKSMKQMIISKAKEAGDPALLGMLKNNVPGQSYTYANMDGGQDLDAAAQDLTSMQLARDRAQREQQDAQDKTQKDQNTGFIVSTLAKNPAATFDPAFMKQAIALDPTIQVQMQGWSSDFAKGNPEDPEQIKGLQTKIMSGQATLSDVTAAMGSNGIIHNPETASKMFDLLNTVNDKKYTPILTNETYKQSIEQIGKDLTDPDSASAVFDPEHVDDDVMGAKLDFQNSMMAWAQANPDQVNNYMAVSTQAAATLKRIQSGYSGGQGSAPAYNTPSAVQMPQGTQPANQAAVASGQEAPSAIPPNPLVKSQADVKTAADNAPAGDTDPWAGTSAPQFSSLPQDQKNKINAAATARGIDPQTFVDNIFARGTTGFAKAPQTVGSLNGDQNNADYITPSMADGGGMAERGNIDLKTRNAFVDNKDGSYSTVATIGVQDPDGKEVVIPTIIPDGKGGWTKASDAQAEDYYRQTGQNFGKFTNVADADKYAEALHNDQAKQSDALGAAAATIDKGEDAMTATKGSAPGVPGAIPSAPPAAAASETQDSLPANYMRASKYGNPEAPGWAKANLVTITSPEGKKFTVNKWAASSFQGFLADLKKNGYTAGEVEGYNPRSIRGSTTISQHAFGNAIDVNPSANPMGNSGKQDLPANIAEIASRWGLKWGGSFHSRKDPMHFEWAGIPASA